MKSKIISRTSFGLMILNMIAVFFNASLFLYGTKYITNMGYAHNLLENLNAATLGSPVSLFWKAVIVILAICGLFMYRNNHETKNMKYSQLMLYAEWILSVYLLWVLHCSYNGFVLLIIIDMIFHTRDHKYMAFLMSLGFMVLLFSDYNVLSRIISFVSVDAYVDFFPQGVRSILSFERSLLASLNMVVFILLLLLYLMDSLREKHHIEEELLLASQVNDNLNSYLALSDKIAEDRERKRIARELHDTIGHALTGISAGIDAVMVLMDVDQEKAKAQLKVISKVVREGIVDVRRSLNKMRPGALEGHTLKDALTKILKEYEEVSHLNIDLYYEWNNVDLDNTKEDVIFRVIEESLTNSLRHGHAKHVEIDMFIESNNYYIVIQDDGIGCADIKNGFGLKQMNERLGMIGGKASFSGTDGFRTLIEIPMKKGENQND